MILAFLQFSVFNQIHKQNEDTILKQQWHIQMLVFLATCEDRDAVIKYIADNPTMSKYLCACVIYSEGMIKIIDGKMYRYVQGFWKLIPKYNFIPKNRRSML
jgi:hypothetical protein